MGDFALQLQLAHNMYLTSAVNSVGLFWPEGSNLGHSLLTWQTIKSHLTYLVFLAPQERRNERYTFIARIFGTGEREYYTAVRKIHAFPFTRNKR